MALTKHGFGDLLPDDDQQKKTASQQQRDRILAEVQKENEESDEE